MQFSGDVRFLTTGIRRFFWRSAVMERSAEGRCSSYPRPGGTFRQVWACGPLFCAKWLPALHLWICAATGAPRAGAGHINRYAELLDDLEMVVDYHTRDGAPMFLYGHSLGAQITLNYLLRRSARHGFGARRDHRLAVAGIGLPTRPHESAFGKNDDGILAYIHPGWPRRSGQLVPRPGFPRLIARGRYLSCIIKYPRACIAS